MSGWLRLAVLLVLGAGLAGAQQAWESILGDGDPKVRVKALRLLVESDDGFRHLDLLEPLLADPQEQVRLALATALIKLRTADAQALLMRLTEDLSPRVQSLAVDGLVDYYHPNYVRSGWSASVSSLASDLKGRFSKPNPVTVAEYANVNPSAVEAVAGVLRQGRSDEARANAARALGVLLARESLADLVDGTRSRNSKVILECLLAIRKIKDTSAGPQIVFLLDDPDPAIRAAAVRAVGQLQARDAVPGLVSILAGADKREVRVQAMIALAKIPDNGQRELFLRYLVDSDKGLRAAAAEGVGRVGMPEDARLVDHHFQLEKSASVKASLAFASVLLGNHVRLNDLVGWLNSTAHRMEARPFLVELARNDDVLKRLYVPLSTGTDAQRRHLAYVLSQSGTADSVPHLENLAKDRNSKVAGAAVEALRVLRGRF